MKPDSAPSLESTVSSVPTVENPAQAKSGWRAKLDNAARGAMEKARHLRGGSTPGAGLPAETATQRERVGVSNKLMEDFGTWREFSNRNGGSGNVPLSEYVTSEENTVGDQVRGRIQEIYSSTAESILSAGLTPDNRVAQELLASFTIQDRQAIKDQLKGMSEQILANPATLETDRATLEAWTRPEQTETTNVTQFPAEAAQSEAPSGRLAEANQAIKESRIESVRNGRVEAKRLVQELQNGGDFVNMQDQLVDALDKAWVRPNSRIMRELKRKLADEYWKALYARVVDRVQLASLQARQGTLASEKQAWLASWDKQLQGSETPTTPKRVEVVTRLKGGSLLQKAAAVIGFAGVLGGLDGSVAHREAQAGEIVGQYAYKQEGTLPSHSTALVDDRDTPVGRMGSAVGDMQRSSITNAAATLAGVGSIPSGLGIASDEVRLANTQAVRAASQAVVGAAATTESRKETSQERRVRRTMENTPGIGRLEDARKLQTANARAVGQRLPSAQEQQRAIEAGNDSEGDTEGPGQYESDENGPDKAEQRRQYEAFHDSENTTDTEGPGQIEPDEAGYDAARKILLSKENDELIAASEERAAHARFGVDGSDLLRGEQMVADAGKATNVNGADLLAAEQRRSGIDAQREILTERNEIAPQGLNATFNLRTGENFWNVFNVEGLNPRAQDAIKATIANYARANGKGLDIIQQGSHNLEDHLTAEQLANVNELIDALRGG